LGAFEVARAGGAVAPRGAGASPASEGGGRRHSAPPLAADPARRRRPFPLPLAQAAWEEDLTHAFCVSLKQSEKVAGLVHALVERRLAELGRGGGAPPPPAAAAAAPAAAAAAGCGCGGEAAAAAELSPQASPRQLARL
jgi:hypothetical protein